MTCDESENKFDFVISPKAECKKNIWKDIFYLFEPFSEQSFLSALDNGEFDCKQDKKKTHTLHWNISELLGWIVAFYFKRWAIPSLFFFIFVFTIEQLVVIISAMSEFELV